MQPISGVGLVGLAVYSHLVLKEKLATLEWLAVALAFAGTLGLGATSSDAGGSSSGAGGSGGRAIEASATAGAAGAADSGDAAAAAAAAAGEPGALRMLGVLLALALAVLLVSLLRSRHSHRQRRGGDKSAAASYGLQAGACFGLSAASCRIGGLAWVCRGAAVAGRGREPGCNWIAAARHLPRHAAPVALQATLQSSLVLRA